jgi:hypothetical protein
MLLTEEEIKNLIEQIRSSNCEDIGIALSIVENQISNNDRRTIFSVKQFLDSFFHYPDESCISTLFAMRKKVLLFLQDVNQ